jgi:hypothetical protein
MGGWGNGYTFTPQHHEINRYTFNVIHTPCIRLTIQYLFQLIAHVIINICYFVTFLLHVSAHIGNDEGGPLQRNICLVNAVKDVHKYS